MAPAFGEYLDFSNQTFSVREVKRLWAVHGCVTKHKRPLVIYSDQVEKGFRCTRCLCDDWTKVRSPIIHFKGAIGSGVLQLLLKNAHPAMRSAAAELLGNPAIPSSRPNAFGELFRAFIAPNPEIQEAVNWALRGGPDPDVALHLRMLHSRTRPAPASASNCIHRIVRHNIDPKLLKRYVEYIGLSFHRMLMILTCQTENSTHILLFKLIALNELLNLGTTSTLSFSKSSQGTDLEDRHTTVPL